MIRRIATLLTVAMLAAAPAMAAEKFTLDPEHTAIVFYIDHLGFSDMIGRFTDFSGGFEFDQQHPENSSADVVIHPASVVTSSKKLDEKLQGEDWFNTAKYPDARFTSTYIHVTGPQDAEITGNFTLMGVTKPVTLRVHFNRADYTPVTNNYVAGFTASGVITRSQFGMGKYVPMVGDDVRLKIEVEGISQLRKPGKPINPPEQK